MTLEGVSNLDRMEFTLSVDNFHFVNPGQYPLYPCPGEALWLH